MENLNKEKETKPCTIQNVVTRFEALAKERNICFMYDYEDGYFINVSDKGSPPEVRQWQGVAEIIQTKNHNLIECMQKATEFMEKENEDFRKHLASVG
jgi:hypothetical protein